MKRTKLMTIGLAAVLMTVLPEWTLAKGGGNSGKGGSVGKPAVTRERPKSGKDGNTGTPAETRDLSRSGKDGNTGGTSEVTSFPPERAVHLGHGKAEGDNGHGENKGENGHGGKEGENGHGGAKGKNKPDKLNGQEASKGEPRIGN